MLFALSPEVAATAVGWGAVGKMRASTPSTSEDEAAAAVGTREVGVTLSTLGPDFATAAIERIWHE
jgi:hypothetical protein